MEIFVNGNFPACVIEFRGIRTTLLIVIYLKLSGSSSVAGSAITSIESSWGSSNPYWSIDGAIMLLLLRDDVESASGKRSVTK